MSNEDRRREKRTNINAEIVITAPETTLAGKALEISVEGMRIQSNKAVTPGAKVAVTLKMAEEFILHGVVLWALSLLSDGLPAYQMGIGTESIAAKDMLAVGYAQKSEIVRKIVRVSQNAVPPEDGAGG